MSTSMTTRLRGRERPDPSRGGSRKEDDDDSIKVSNFQDGEEETTLNGLTSCLESQCDPRDSEKKGNPLAFPVLNFTSSEKEMTLFHVVLASF